MNRYRGQSGYGFGPRGLRDRLLAGLVVLVVLAVVQWVMPFLFMAKRVLAYMWWHFFGN